MAQLNERMDDHTPPAKPSSFVFDTLDSPNSAFRLPWHMFCWHPCHAKFCVRQNSYDATTNPVLSNGTAAIRLGLGIRQMGVSMVDPEVHAHQTLLRAGARTPDGVRFRQQKRAMTDKKRVLTACPNAFCAHDSGLYQVMIPRSEPSLSLLPYQSLSSPQNTEVLAWHFAAARVRLEERAKARMEANRRVVAKRHSRAYCAHLRGDFYQIRRPRLRDDKPATLDYVTLSGRFSSEMFAWQDAARRVKNSNDCELATTYR
jgi:hypothetical protein